MFFFSRALSIVSPAVYAIESIWNYACDAIVQAGNQMLRIHIEEECNCARLRLEGKLAGAWVEELARCCHDALGRREHRPVVIQLDAVTFVDDAGQSLLRTMHGAGVKLEARGAQSRHLVEQIQQQQALQSSR